MDQQKKLEYAKQLALMLSVPTVTHCEQALFDQLHEHMRTIAPHFFELPLEKPLGNALIFKWEGKKHDRPMVLMGHQDVVPEGDVSKWKYPPYAGTIAEDRVWGRGALDCKSTVFATMVAAEELISQGFVPEQDIYFCYGDDEEVGGGGAKAEAAYLKSHNITPALVLDEGGGILTKDAMPKMLTKSVGALGVCEKGFADFKFYARSKGGHSSTPPKNTPFVRLSRFVLYLERHNIFERKATALIKEMFAGLSQAFKPAMRPFVKRAYLFLPFLEKFSPATATQIKAFVQTTMVFTMSQGAAASNNIPDAAWMLANIRYSPQEGKEKTLAKLQKIAKRYDIDIEIVNSREASPIADTSSAEYKLVCDTITGIYGDTALAPYLLCGGTDCRNMQELCPTAIRFTPFLVSMDEMHRCHAYDECLPIDALAQGVEFFKTLIREWH